MTHRPLETPVDIRICRRSCARPVRRPSLLRRLRWIAAVEGCEDAVPQDLVLLAASPRWARRALLDLTADDDFRWLELASCQVDLGAVNQSIPVVVADLGVSGEDLA